MSKFHWEEVQKLARAHHIQDPLDNVETFTRFLQFWWSQKYNRPLKDPLLHSYTLEELAYEWLRHVYLRPDHDPKKELEKNIATEEEDEWIKAQLKKVIEKAQEPKPVEIEEKPAEVVALPELPDISTKFD